MKDGYIKYQCNLSRNILENYPEMELINIYRRKLRKLKMVGVYPSGISYGNVSMRIDKFRFLITGTQTGSFDNLEACHFAIVNGWDIDKNILYCVGELNASSEALSHAAIYEVLTNCNAVIHVHHLQLWKQLLNKIPTIPESAEYGTPEIANAIANSILSNNAQTKGNIALAGHYEGLISYGETIESASTEILKYF